MVVIETQLKRQASVNPHWLAQGDAFWYLRNGKGDKSEFIFVDILKRTRIPAFDHNFLANELQRQTGSDTNHEALPFTEIDIQPDASYVRFRCFGKKWQYGPDNVLQEIENSDDDDESDDRLLSKEIPSGDSSNPVSVKFINHSNGAVQLFWIDWDAKPNFYAEIDVGATHQQETYQGHVWRIVDEASGKTIAIYSAPNQSNDIFVIQDRDIKQVRNASGGELNDNPEPNTGNNAMGKNTGEAKANSTVEIRDSMEQTKAKESSADLDETNEPKRHIFVSENNLWLKGRDGTTTKLSSNGSEENKYDDSEIYMSPDEHYVVAWQLTPAQEHLINLVESSPADRIEPRLQSIQYLKPGDRIKEGKVHLFDLDGKCEINIDNSLFANPYHLESIGWSSNGEEYRFIFNERGHQHTRVLSICRDGRVRALLEESSNTFIDYSSKMYCWVVEDTDEMIWASERDGYNHLYLIDLNEGTVKAQITKGQWNVRSVEHVDESRRRIWLKVFGVVQDQDPYYAYPAYVNFDGTGFQVLAEGDGTHSWSLSADKRYIVDTYSRVNFPPQTHLRDGETGESIIYCDGEM